MGREDSGPICDRSRVTCGKAEMGRRLCTSSRVWEFEWRWDRKDVCTAILRGPRLQRLHYYSLSSFTYDSNEYPVVVIIKKVSWTGNMKRR